MSLFSHVLRVPFYGTTIPITFYLRKPIGRNFIVIIP